MRTSWAYTVAGWQGFPWRAKKCEKCWKVANSKDKIWLAAWKKGKGKKSIFTSSSALKTYYLISASKNESRMKRMQQYTIYLAHKPDIYCYVHRRRICATFFSSPSPSSPYFLFTPSRPSSLFLHASMARWREKRLKARLCWRVYERVKPVWIPFALILYEYSGFFKYQRYSWLFNN